MWVVVCSGLFLSLQCFLSLYTTVFKVDNIKLFNDIYLLFIIGGQSTKSGVVEAVGLFMERQQVTIVLPCISAIAAGLLMIEKRRSRRLFLGVTIVLHVIALFLVKQRTGVFALLPMAFVFLFINRRLRKKFFQNATVIVLAFLLCGLIVEGTTSSHKKGGKGSRIVEINVDSDSSLQSRVLHWESGITWMRENSLMLRGLGIGGYEKGGLADAHNLMLSLFFDFGAVGAIIGFWILFILAENFFKLIKYQETYFQTMSLVFGVILFGIALMSLVYIPYYRSSLWLFLAMASSTFSLAKKELEEKDRGSHLV
jgi:hypothetical protein